VFTTLPSPVVTIGVVEEHIAGLSPNGTRIFAGLPLQST